MSILSKYTHTHVSYTINFSTNIISFYTFRNIVVLPQERQGPRGYFRQLLRRTVNFDIYIFICINLTTSRAPRFAAAAAAGGGEGGWRMERNANARILAVGANGRGYGSGGGDTGGGGGRMIEAEVTPRARRGSARPQGRENAHGARESATRKTVARRKGKDRRRGNGGPAPTTLRYDSPGVANRLRGEPSRR